MTITPEPAPQHVYRVSEIRDSVLRRIHGYHASLDGAFGYCEAEERKKPLVDSARFELFGVPGGGQWLVHGFAGPEDQCPETSDLVISRVDVIPDEAGAAPPTGQDADGYSSRAAEAELYFLLRKAGEDRHEAQALIDRHRAAVLPTTDRAATLTDAERTMLTYALNQAQLRLWRHGPASEEDQAALNSLRRMADEAQPETQADGSPAQLAKVVHWVTSRVVIAETEFGEGYRAAQRDIRDLINGRFDNDAWPAVVSEPGKETDRG